MKKRTLTLILVLVLALSLSVTALAHNLPNHPTISGGTGAATITITANGVQQYSGNISGVTLYDGINGLSNANPDWDNAPDWYDSSIIHKALTSLYGYSTSAGTFADLGQVIVGQDGIPYTIYLDENNVSYQVKANAQVLPGYYLLGSGNGVYHYLYIGKDWTYSDTVSGTIYDYMCDYVLNGQSITLTYTLQTTDWTTTTPLP